MEHTATPWIITTNSYKVTDRNGNDVLNFNHHIESQIATNKANARHIVKCVNMHDELVEGLKELYECIQELPDTGLSCRMSFIVEQLLEKCKEA